MNGMNGMNEMHHYNIPMFGVKHWYEKEMEAVGHLASMEDAYLRRMYASKVVNGMNHLSKAIQEKVNDPGYEHKKRDLELMKAGIMRAMDHLKKDYDVSEGNISYKWNTGSKMPSSFEPSMNMSPQSSMPPLNNNSLSLNTEMPSSMPKLNENTLSMNTEGPLSLNEDDEIPVLTLNNMKNFSRTKTGSSNVNAGNSNMNKTLNVNRTVLNLNATANANATANPTANANVNANKNKNKNKNKNTLVGGRRHRKNRKGRRTRRRS